MQDIIAPRFCFPFTFIQQTTRHASCPFQLQPHALLQIHYTTIFATCGYFFKITLIFKKQLWISQVMHVFC